MFGFITNIFRSAPNLLIDIVGPKVLPYNWRNERETEKILVYKTKHMINVKIYTLYKRKGGDGEELLSKRQCMGFDTVSPISSNQIL